MTHYSNEPSRVRVDFFKATGKWYETIEMPWVHEPDTTWDKPGILLAEFKKSVRRAMGDRLQGMTAVCLEPYHPHACPVMWINYQYEPGYAGQK